MKDYISYELAVKLKEKGFNEPCYAFYSKHGCLEWNNIDTYYRPNQKIDLDDLTQTYNNGNSFCLTDAPTISQVLKWLREERQVDVLIDILIKYDENLNRKRQYTAKILTPKLNKPIYVCSVYIYEKALTHAIDYVLDNLI